MITQNDEVPAETAALRPTGKEKQWVVIANGIIESEAN